MFRPIMIAAVAATATPALAQDMSLDIAQLRSVDDANVVNAAGDKLGEIEDVLVGADGKPVAYVVDTGGFLDIGDEDVVVSIDALQWQGGQYVSDMTEEQLEALPKWDD
ncbi:PRC-barrel domain-containing protein [Roseovarius nanhaiticus]|uniref:PRC-barrel domain-containing protein n=1 Tax=Roseovarius nanhaiticus TaxID=573024 RepID=A0A1N7EGA7_9RHOB|nr:PRC-barrel domain-containing protein [Roseovarius nanhaiticus]SEK75162.1 PRC-barrel domain-containing protein [Roseovarius nanhaiticus]SIR87131.1 PRC-barrel domain-containing protein [Roseovarius nanhaiticus]